MATPFLAEIKILSFNFAPKGWAACNGQVMPIAQNTALFSLLGTTYGGDGRVTFALPDLQGRVPFHMGGAFTLGQRGGEETHTLINSEMPAHTHAANASSAAANQASPEANFWANGAVAAYANGSNTSMATQDVLPVGGSQAHENRSPFLTLNFVIALQGIFPSQN